MAKAYTSSSSVYTNMTEWAAYKKLITWQDLDKLAENDARFEGHLDGVGSGTPSATNPHGLKFENLGGSLPANSVGQGQLKTASGEVNVQTHHTGSGVLYGGWGTAHIALMLGETSYITVIFLYIKIESYEGSSQNAGHRTLPGGEYGFYPQIKVASQGSLETDRYGWIYAKQRYVTASGRDHWIFLLVDKKTKEIVGGYEAPDHPCANQGRAIPEDIPHPFGSYDPEKYEVILVDNKILEEIRPKVTPDRGILEIISEEYIVGDVSRPRKIEPREIVKINEYPDRPIGEVIQKIKRPEWAKIMIQPEEISLERIMVEKLPEGVYYGKLVRKK